MSKEENVVNFPSTAGGTAQENSSEPNPVSIQEAPKHNEIVLNLVDKNRKKGLETLEKRIDNLDHRELHENSKTESALRDITTGLKGINTTVEALNSLSDMIRHDLINCIQNLENQVQANWQVSVHLQTLIEVLKTNGVITEKQLEETWKSLIENAAAATKKDKL